jgi:hypothetical protein
MHLKSNQSGSALLLTLMVVSLLMVITLAFTVYVRMELRVVVNQQQQHQAQANARLGVQLAVGRLHELAGTDTRVTARADLFSPVNPYLAELPHTLRTHWRGVWRDTGAHPFLSSPEFLGWLVSGESDNLTEITGSPFDNGDVPLFADGSALLSSDIVPAPKVDLADTGGAYAWWARDESVKARIDLLDPWRNDPAQRHLSHRAAQRHGIERFFTDPALYPAANTAFDALKSKWLNLEHPGISFASGSPAADAYAQLALRYPHDITLHSTGVLSDTRSGGLKRDLTQAFEMPLDRFRTSEFAGGNPQAEIPDYQPSGYPTNEAVAYPVRIEDLSPFGIDPEPSPRWTSPSNPDTASSTLDPVFRSPSWHLFRNFYRLYKTTDPDRSAFGLDANAGVTGTSSPTIQGQSFFPGLKAWNFARRYGQDPHTWAFNINYKSNNESDTTTISEPLGRPVFPAVSPVVLRVQMVVSLKTRPDPALPGHHVIDLYLDPVVTLWNPYTVALRTGEANGQPLQLSVMNFDLMTQIDTDGDNGVELEREFSEPFSLGESGPDTFERRSEEAFQLNIDLPSGFTMDAGEIMVVSGKQGTVLYDRNESSYDISGVIMELEPGIGYLPDDSGFLFENAFDTSIPDMMPDGITSRELRFRMRKSSASSTDAKFKVQGVNRTGNGVEPFFGSFQGIVDSRINQNWSAPYPLNAPDLTLEKHPFGVYDTYMRTESSGQPLPLFQQFNPRAFTHEQGTFMLLEETATLTGTFGQEDLWLSGAQALSDWNGTWLDTHGSHGAYWGSSYQSGRTHVALYEIPRDPMVSLGELRHTPMTFLSDEPAMPLGNSFPSIFHERDAVISLQQFNTSNRLVSFGQARTPLRDDWTMTRPDWSYLLNQALWDRYYFSGITGDPLSILQGTDDAPNSSLDPWLPPGTTAADAASTLRDSGGITEEAPSRISAHLLQSGAFNINSTSVEAWTAVLSSARGAVVDTDESSPAANGTPFSRFATPPQDDENEKWRGFRSLTDTQISDLAAAIVDQVRLRGPFLSLSDFINRDPDAGSPYDSMGALQAAIEAAGINDSIPGSSLDGSGFNAGSINNRQWIRSNLSAISDRPVADGITGFLTQADVLSALAPFLTARGDTFVVRSYGETEDGGARAWCEAVVQRTPEWVDSTRTHNAPSTWPAHELPADTGTYDTAIPKRRFRILSFRWLNPDEV